MQLSVFRLADQRGDTEAFEAGSLGKKPYRNETPPTSEEGMLPSLVLAPQEFRERTPGVELGYLREGVKWQGLCLLKERTSEEEALPAVSIFEGVQHSWF